MKNRVTVGIDIGGTKVKAARIKGDQIVQTSHRRISSQGTKEQVLEEVQLTIEEVWTDAVAGIGVGAPSIVDAGAGIVYDVQNIPSWKEVPLKQILEDHFRVRVSINNDANCFVLGEKQFGKGRDYNNLVGLITGTGMAAGIVIQDCLYDGFRCGAGEFGMLPYLDHNYEYYCSGQYFTNIHQLSGETLYRRAQQGDQQALTIFREYGRHLGHGVTAILYTLAPELIILGGSVSLSHRYYEGSLWEQLRQMAFPSLVEHLRIEVSENPDIALLGAAVLLEEGSGEVLG